MKHTRSILNQIHSEPSFESMDILDIPLIDVSENSFLAMESMEILNDVNGQFEEIGQLHQKEENLDTLSNYVESEVNCPTEEGPLRTATQNEVALVEQAVAANTDGTGISEDDVLPSLESAVGSTIALEGIKETLGKFGDAVASMVKGIGAGFVKFMKVIFTRLGALRAQIESAEKKISSGELKTEPFDVSKQLSRYALLEGNDTIMTSKSLATAMANLFGSMREIGTEYPKQIMSQYDTVIKQLDIWLRKGQGRGNEKREVRDGVTKVIIDELKKTVALNTKTFHDSKLLGGFIINYTQPTLKEGDMKSSLKSMFDNFPVVATAGNDNSRETTFKFDSVADAKAIVNTIKSSLGFLGKVSKTNSMHNVDFFTTHFSLTELIIDLLVDGSESTGYKFTIRDLNHLYVKLYTSPAMEIIEHYMRVASAQLTLIEKSFK